MVQPAKQAWMDPSVMDKRVILTKLYFSTHTQYPSTPHRCSWNLPLLAAPFAVSFFSGLVLPAHLCCRNRPDAGKSSLTAPTYTTLSLPPRCVSSILSLSVSLSLSLTHTQPHGPVSFPHCFYYLSFSFLSLI